MLEVYLLLRNAELKCGNVKKSHAKVNLAAHSLSIFDIEQPPDPECYCPSSAALPMLRELTLTVPGVPSVILPQQSGANYPQTVTVAQ